MNITEELRQPTENFYLIGLKIKLRSTKEEENDLSGIPHLWQNVNQLLSENGIKLSLDAIGNRFVMITGDSLRNKEDEAYYYAFYKIDEDVYDNIQLDPKYEKIAFERGEFHWFRYAGPLTQVGEFAFNIQQNWLTDDRLLKASTHEFFLFPINFKPEDSHSSFFYGIHLR